MFTVQVKDPIKEPVVRLDGSTDFIYIMRKDGPYVAASIAERLSRRTGIARDVATSVLGYHYDAFHARLVDILGAHLSSGDRAVEIHLYEAEPLKRIIEDKTHGQRVINADPLLEGSLPSLYTSRHYALSGVTTLKQGERPGSPPMSMQLDNLANDFGNSAVVITEDDIFSGKSMVDVIEALRGKGVPCSHVYPGIQVGMTPALSALNVAVDPAVQYLSVTKRDLFDQIDLGDARDFLLGASGLVVVLPTNTFGRAPYVLPFVSPHARAGIAAAQEYDFSSDVLLANREFFVSVESLLATPLILSDVDPCFARMCQSLYGFPATTKLSTVVEWALSRMEPLYRINSELGKVQSDLYAVTLPSRMVLLDLNGTLIPDDATDCHLQGELLQQLRSEIARLADAGIEVGLCSDSPLEPLKCAIAAPLGMRGPIIAENGNILYHNDKRVRLRTLQDIEGLRHQIEKIVAEAPVHYAKQQDCLSGEFGGQTLRFDQNEWAFGAGRESSISIFAPESLVSYLAEKLVLASDVSMDISADHNYLAIHPGSFRTNKGETLNALAAFGYGVHMIGNSMSDWVNPTSGVRCGFVGGSTVPKEILRRAALTSTQPNTHGVIEILGMLR
jgi:hydroxymethylpyrimidine pyrophosphatase-like HAD family hydrolase